jgi:hypothetical protein
LFILFAQISPSVHLVEAAVDFKAVISATATSIFVRLELLATATLTRVVRGAACFKTAPPPPRASGRAAFLPGAGNPLLHNNKKNTPKLSHPDFISDLGMMQTGDGI